MANPKNFTKALGSTSAEALHATLNVYAEDEVWFDAPASNAGAITIRDEDDVILKVFEPGTHDRIKVDRTRMPNPNATTAKEYLGDCARVGGADVGVYRNGGFGRSGTPPAQTVGHLEDTTAHLPVQGAGNSDAVLLFTLSSWSAQGTTSDVIHVNCR